MTLRLLHLSNDLYPRVTGGTELFVRQLIDAQRQLSDPPELLWAAHRTDPALAASPSAPPPAPDQVALPPAPPSDRHGTLSLRSAAIPGFAELLTRFRPDVLHLHSLSAHCGLMHVEAARRAGVAVVITLHSPGFTCLQGSLLYHRRTICDGLMRADRCTECRLVNGGVPSLAAWLLARQRGWPLSTEMPGALAHMLTGRQLTEAFHQAFHALISQVQGVHVLAEWSRQVALLNGVPEGKLHLIRTAGPAPLAPRRRRPLEDGILRLVFWGRCAEVKGLHLIIDAMASLPPELPIELTFYGPNWDGDYGQAMRQRIAGDRRFRLADNLPQADLLPRLQAYDLAVVPSTWLETGPLTVLEAWAAGLPVAGTDLGGIRELLSGRRGCFLVPMHSSGWRELLVRLLRDPQLLTEPEAPQRRFSHLAAEMAALYAQQPSKQ